MSEDLCFQTSKCENYPLDAADDEETRGYKLIALLAEGADWVDLINSDGDRTRWSVMERDIYGFPTQVLSDEFDGTTEIISITED